MRVGIVGAGFTGLTAGLRLAQKGIEVELFEAQDKSGGLAGSFKLANWGWPLEYFYHHIFADDYPTFKLARELGLTPLFFRPTTAVYFKKQIYPFDSTVHLLNFPYLSWTEKFRMAAALGTIKICPFWKSFEQWTADEFQEALIENAAGDSTKLDAIVAKRDAIRATYL